MVNNIPALLAAAALGLAGPAALAQPGPGAIQGNPGGTTILVFPPGTATAPAAPPKAAPSDAATPQAAGTGAVGGQAVGPQRSRARVVGPYNRGQTEVVAEVLSLRREANTLMLRVMMHNEGGVNANSVAMYVALNEAHIVDPSTQRRAGVMKTPGGESLSTDMSASGVPAGGRQEMFAQFPEPPASVTSVNLYLKGFPPIMGVPIAP